MLSALEQRVLAEIDDAELIRWVQELTRLPSVWKPETGEGEEAAARWVEARCRALGLETHFEWAAPGRPNVIARLGPGAGPRTLMFEGHTDVVTEGDPALWTDPPFSATLRDGRIYGRGANDMKAGLVCALAAVQALARSGVRLGGEVLLGALCDEEGQMLGVKHFVERGWADRVTAAIICEPEENHLCVAQKGVMWLRAVVRGVMAHGAMPLTGVNSAYPLARFLTAVHGLEEREIARHGRHEFLGQPSITPTILLSPPRGAGEPQNNVMPGAAECVLDYRLIPGQDPDWLAGQTEQLLQAAVAVDPRLSGELTVLEVRHPTRTAREEPVVAALASAYADLAGAPPIYGGVPGSTDGTILNARRGIPIVTCGPGDIHIPHHVDEWVSVDEIKQAARLYVLAALRYLGVADD
ncbi:MAG: M20 family metallopeptidase [Anaerolineales bacterium]|nr:M20 family metallopeptidase [Anaerolineales bacterium]